ncbi:MAG: adenine phosphoribosyltransferase [Candidatus Micrarchaeota archaeon]|nr:adenine phosphoribosyltransferase [Candidatus Micrarchaeota archaeon]
MPEFEALLKEKIRSIPDYPKKGVIFRDITPLLKDYYSFSMCIDELASEFEGEKIDYVVGIEARGFIIGGALAEKLGVGFIPIRKKGKLPYKKVSIDYELEYGKETIEVHEDAVEKGSRVLIVDDLLATGGTAKAAADLMQKVGARVVGLGFLVELGDMKGKKKLDGARIVSLAKY